MLGVLYRLLVLAMVLLSWMRLVVWTTVLAALLGMSGERSAMGDERSAMGDGRRATGLGTSNPRQLRALQVLDRRKPGVAARVRFEWDPAPGARKYVLTGHWTSPPSWAVQSQQYRVTSQNAVTWESRRVVFEATLPEGFHSWSVVALFGPDEHGDFAHPTSVTFEVR
jgi:hypothetical protein